MPAKPSKADLFLELAKPNKKGFSRKVFVSEFVGKYAELTLGNGGSWCRDDSTLGRRYNIQRQIEKGRIVYIKLHGFNTKQVIDKGIPPDIRNALKDLPCVVLHTRPSEIDHKDGRRDDPRPPEELTVDDFQPLSKAANNAKRQHCKNCRNSDKRFDATQIGYPVGQVQGDGVYRGTCVGCYWYDPKEFNSFFELDATDT